MQRPLLWKELLGDRAPTLRSTAAMLTSLTALAATSLIAAPGPPYRCRSPCTLRRTQAHHSEGLDTWNSAYPRPTRDLDAVMVFLSFPDAAPLTTPAELTADHFPATSELLRTRLVRQVHAPSRIRAGQWLEMPQAVDGVRHTDVTGSAAHRAAYLRDALATADPHVDFSRYDIVYFVADPDAPGVDSDATKVVNLDTPLKVDGTDIRRVVTVFERHPPDRLVLAHETGHVFDLPDLYHRPVDGKGDWDTYVGDWDLMGSQFALAPDLFAWHKWKLGWLGPRQVTCVRGTGPTRLTLEPVGAGPGVRCGGRRRAGLRARPRDQAGGRPYRGRQRARHRGAGPVGNDGSVCTQGVLVYRVRSGAESGGGPIEVLDAHPRTEACWERVRLPAPRGRAGGRGRELHGAGGRRGSRVEVEEARRRRGRGRCRITTWAGGPGVRHTNEGPSLPRGAPSCLCAARDSNPGPAD